MEEKEEEDIIQDSLGDSIIKDFEFLLEQEERDENLPNLRYQDLFEKQIEYEENEGSLLYGSTNYKTNRSEDNNDNEDDEIEDDENREEDKILISELRKEEISEEWAKKRQEIFPTFDNLFKHYQYPSEKLKISDSKTFDNSTEYLEKMFYLFKEEYLELLRIDMDSFIKNEQYQIQYSYIQQYENFSISKCKFSELGLKANITIQFKQKLVFLDVKEEQNSRLIGGSLLLFINRQSYFIFPATIMGDERVREKEELNLIDTEIKKETTIIFQVDSDKVVQVLKELTHPENLMLVEGKKYWLPFQFTLQNLQRLLISKNSVPSFQEEIIKISRPCGQPNYEFYQDNLILQEEYYDTIQDKIDELEKLDQTQKECLEYVLKNSIALVQGPPGTGKTFIAVQAIKILLDTYCKQKKAKPILVICKRNDTVDTFIDKLKDRLTKDEMVRVGGMSNNQELVEKYLLSNQFKPSFQYDKPFSSLIRKMNKQIDDLIKDNKFKLNMKQQILEVEKLFSKCKEPSYLNEVQKYFFLQSQKEVGFTEIQSRNYIEDKANDKINQQILFWWLQNDSSYLDILDIFQNYGVQLTKIQKYRLLQYCKINNLCKEELSQQFNNFSYSLIEQDLDEPLLANMFKQPQFLQNAPPIQNEKVLNEIQLTFEKCLLAEKLSDISFYALMNVQLNMLSLERDKIIKKFILQMDDFKKYQNLRTVQSKVKCSSFLHNRRVILMTLTGSHMKYEDLKLLEPEIIFIDEAAEIVESDLSHLLWLKPKHIIQVGDHFQLKPIINNSLIQHFCNFGFSMFERLYQSKVILTNQLKVQWRMTTELANFVRLFYQKGSYIDSNIVNKFPRLFPQQLMGDIKFIHHTFQETHYKDTQLKVNIFEAFFCTLLVKRLIHEENIKPSQISVISMYKGQKLKITEMMNHLFGKEEDKLGLDMVKISTVDGYQGQENDVIIISCVRSNLACQMGFLKLQNRINVAFSRARRALFVVGNFKMLGFRSNNIWQEIVGIADQRQYGRSIQDYMKRIAKKYIPWMLRLQPKQTACTFCNKESHLGECPSNPILKNSTYTIREYEIPKNTLQFYENFQKQNQDQNNRQKPV